MKKATILILSCGWIFLTMLSAQRPQSANPDIENFDNDVAKMKPIQKKIDVSVDVVGLEIRKGSTEATQLAKVAEAGTGHYYPVANAADLSKVFTQITTGAGSGGGGGIITSGYSQTNWPLIFGLFFVFGSFALLLGILIAQRRRSSSPAPRFAPRTYGTLHVTYPGGGTKSVSITGSRSSIGRNEGNQIVLHDSNISGTHAELYITQDGYLLRDLGSTNGTYVNGTRISEQHLYLGDEILMGETRLIFGE